MWIVGFSIEVSVAFMNHTSTLADHCIHSIHCIHCWVALCLVPCLQEGEGERSIVRGAHQVEAAQMLCIWLQGSVNELVLISVFFLSMPLFHFMSKLSYTIIYCNYSLRYDECHSPWCVGRTWGLRWTSSSRNMFAVRTAPGPQREMAGHGGPWRAMAPWQLLLRSPSWDRHVCQEGHYPGRDLIRAPSRGD